MYYQQYINYFLEKIIQDLAEIFILFFVVTGVSNHKDFKAFHRGHYNLAKRGIIYCLIIFKDETALGIFENVKSTSIMWFEF